MNYLPRWLSHYQRADLPHDLLASLTLLTLLIPQGLAYAVLAGLPPQVGLYASVLPALIYALLGSSATLAVGPAALPSLMTAAALAGMALPGGHEYAVLAAALALLSGGLRVVLSALRAGFLANFLSHAVVGGFVSGSALLIVLSQLPSLLGLSLHGTQLKVLLLELAQQWRQIDPTTLALSLAAMLLLQIGKHGLKRLARHLGANANHADLLSKTAPILLIAGSTLLVAWLKLPVAQLGQLPSGLAALSWPMLSGTQWQALLPAALAISLVGFVDSYAIAQSIALRRREKISADRELFALGAANLAAGVSGGYPISASFGRSAANEQAGARSQLSSVLTACWIALLALYGSGLFEFLPRAVLAAIIVVAVSQLIDFSILRLAWRYDRRDAVVYLATAAGVLLLGVVEAILLGVGLSLALFIWRTGQPHMAIVGRVPGSEHFRNVLRHQVETTPNLLLVRIDESLYFANIRHVESQLAGMLNERRTVAELVLILSAVNAIDVSALEVLDTLNHSLQQQGVRLHLAEVKGPVMDKLKCSGVLERLTGQVFLSTHEAASSLGRQAEPDFQI